MVLVKGLQTELSNRKVKNAVWVSREAKPRNEQVEHRHRESQSRLKLRPSPVKNLLEMTKLIAQ